MKLVIDMNLSPAWVEKLASRGFDAVHWSTVSGIRATDAEILGWARHQSAVVVSNDLDFSAILAATGDDSPSVVQLRVHDLMADTAVDLLVATLTTYHAEIEQGALVSIDETGARIRLLPVRRQER